MYKINKIQKKTRLASHHTPLLEMLFFLSICKFIWGNVSTFQAVGQECNHQQKNILKMFIDGFDWRGDCFPNLIVEGNDLTCGN